MHNEIGRSSKLKYKRDTDIRMTCLSKHKKSTKRSNSQRTRTSFKQASYTKKLIHKNQTKGLVLKNAGIPELSKTIFLPKWLADNRVEFILGNWIWWKLFFITLVQNRYNFAYEPEHVYEQYNLSYDSQLHPLYDSLFFPPVKLWTDVNL